MSLTNLPKFILGTLILLFGLMLAPPINTGLIDLTPVIVKVDPKQLKCMTNNIYFEAGNQGAKGMAAVGRIVVNRISHGFGKTPCSVVHQATVIDAKKMCQFSWVCEGKLAPVRDARYLQAELIAYEVLAYNRYVDVLPSTALFFHNTTIDPMWPYKKVAKIGNHIFYSKAKRI